MAEAYSNSTKLLLTGEMKTWFYFIADDVRFSLSTFPGGEPHIKIQEGALKFNTAVQHVYIASRLRNGQELLNLLVTIDAVHRYFPNAEIIAYLPYIPGARQDRAYGGEALTCKVYADLINNSKIDRVITLDPHSDVQTALLDTKQLVITGLDLANKAYTHVHTNEQSFPLIVFPDTGAKKKYVNQLRPNTSINNGKSFRAALNKPWYITGDKLRDTQTGKISGFTVIDDYEFSSEEPVLIVDDICDGGGTFIGLGEELIKRGVNPEKLYLYVTHGIFSKGFKELSKVFKTIYTTDSWSYNYAMEFPLIEKRSEIVHII